MDEPVCELCGNEQATIKLLEVAACDDCAANTLRDTIRETMGHVCASISRNPNSGFLQMCLAPFGTEHNH